MATTQYRISRTLPNGWKIRLDMIPYDVVLGATGNTTVDMGDVCLLELSEQVAEFDDVPYGLVKPQTLKFKLAWSRLPAAVQTYLENSTSAGGRVNTWLLYSDRGTNGATYTLEFAGCEDNIESLELEPIGDGDYSYGVELVDLAYYSMKTTTGYDALATKKGAHRVPNGRPWQMYMDKVSGRNQFHDTYGLLFCDHTRQAMIHVLDALGQKMIDVGMHANPTFGVTYESIGDSTSTARDIFTAAMEVVGTGTWKEIAPLRIPETPNYDYANQGTHIFDTNRPLLSTEIYLTTNVYLGRDNTPVGGLYNHNDIYGWGRKDVSLYDLMRDLCETLGVKASYKFNYVAVAEFLGYDQITVTWYIKRIASSRNYANNVDTADVTLDTDTALTAAKITKRGDNILKSEVRYETSNSEDKTEIVRLTKGARASRSMNVEPIVHNIPVFLSTYDETKGRSEGFKQTNHLYFKGRGGGEIVDGSIFKVHEDTKYWYGPKSTQYISVSSEASDNPVFQSDDNQPKYMVQLAALQAETSMAAALTKLHLKAFSDNNNAIVEMEWNYTQSPHLMCEALPGRHTLTGDVTTTFATLAWDYALPSSIKIDWLAGKSTVKYYLFNPTTAN